MKNNQALKGLTSLAILLGIITLTLNSFAAPANSALLSAERDSFTDLNQPDSNFDDQLLLVESTLGAPGQPDVHTRVLYLAFDLSDVGFEIKSATLSLSALTCDGLLPLDSTTVDVHGIDNDPSNIWTESELTWNNQPLPNAPALISAVSGSEGSMIWADGAGGGFASWLETQRLANDGTATLLLKVDTTAAGGIQDVFFEDREETGSGMGCGVSDGPPQLALDSSFTAYQMFLPIINK